jgi:hypothetical protein
MGLLRYFLIPLSRSSGHAIMALICFGLRLIASGSQDADLGCTGRCLTCKENSSTPSRQHLASLYSTSTTVSTSTAVHPRPYNGLDVEVSAGVNY